MPYLVLPNTRRSHRSSFTLIRPRNWIARVFLFQDVPYSIPCTSLALFLSYHFWSFARWYGNGQFDPNGQRLTLILVKSDCPSFGTNCRATILKYVILQHVAQTIHLYKNVGTAFWNNVNYVSSTSQQFSLQSYNWPPPTFSWNHHVQLPTTHFVIKWIPRVQPSKTSRIAVHWEDHGDAPGRASVAIVGKAGRNVQYCYKF